MRRLSLPRRLIRAALLVAILLGGLVDSLLLTIHFTGQGDQTRPAGAILIPGSGVNYDGSPSPNFLVRIEHGLRLYQDGYAPLIALTGGSRREELREEVRVAEEILLARGGPPRFPMPFAPSGIASRPKSRIHSPVATGRASMLKTGYNTVIVLFAADSLRNAGGRAASAHDRSITEVLEQSDADPASFTDDLDHPHYWHSECPGWLTYRGASWRHVRRSGFSRHCC